MTGWMERVARVAYAFVVINAASVQALVAFARRRTEWR